MSAEQIQVQGVGRDQAHQPAEGPGSVHQAGQCSYRLDRNPVGCYLTKEAVLDRFISMFDG